MIWVGTADGNVQITRDDGETWTEVGRAIADVPDATWVPALEPSHPLEPNLLFLGTEFGLYISLDHGSHWQLCTSNGLPPAPVREIQVHERDADLVVGTHGRGIWVVDDIRPLRELAADPSLGSANLHAFEPPPAILHETAEGIGYRSTGHAMWKGEMRPGGALLSYWVGEDGAAGHASLTVRDASGARIATLNGPARAGVNRVDWDLEAGSDAEGLVPAGSEVLPGVYGVIVAVGGAESAVELEVGADPRRPVDVVALRARAEALAEVRRRWGDLAEEAEDRIDDALEATEGVLSRLPEGAEGEELRTRGEFLLDTRRAVDERLFSGPDCQGICGGDPVASSIDSPAGVLASHPGAPTPLARLMMDQARRRLEAVVAEVNRVLRDEVAPFAEAVEAASLSIFPSTDPLPMPRGGG